MRTKEQRIREYLEIMGTTGIGASVLDDLGFFTAPASTKYHGNYTGGLFDHSLEVTKNLVNLTEKLGLTWEHKDSPYIIGMYHDLCKADAYEFDIEDDCYKYRTDHIIPGHAEKSVIMIQKYLHLTDEEIACIRWHMGAYEKDSKMWGYYNRAIKQYPNVLYTHTADMIASKIIGV